MRRRAFSSALRPGDKACLCRGAHKARPCRDLAPGQCVSDPRARMVNVFPSHASPLRLFRLRNSWFPISLFIFKFKSTDGTGGATPSTELVIDHVIPISGDFSISVALSRRNTIDLRNPSSPLTRNQPRTGKRLSVSFEQRRPLFPIEPLDNADHLTLFRNRRLSPYRTKGHNQSRSSIHPGSVYRTDHPSRERPSAITICSRRMQAIEANRGFVFYYLPPCILLSY